MPLGSFDGPIFFRPTSLHNLFRVEHIRRVFSGTKVPLYRGAMEVGRGTTTAGLPAPFRVNLTNIVEVESYVPGVVANESIASFAIDALKAQAVAARGYAIANIGNYVARGYPFDIVDSSASQVYRGVISEHVNAVRASSETLRPRRQHQRPDHLGDVLVVFWRPQRAQRVDQLYVQERHGRGAALLPAGHLRRHASRRRICPRRQASMRSGARSRRSPLIYDDCAWTGNTFARWKFTLSPATIKARLTTAGTSANTVIVSGTSLAGTITEVEIAQLTGASKRAAIVRLTFTDPAAVAEVRGWEGIRRVIGQTGSPANGFRACNTNPALPPTALPANFVLNNPSSIDVAKNPDGTVSLVTVYGGGWGHNLGMSQYRRARARQARSEFHRDPEGVLHGCRHWLLSDRHRQGAWVGAADAAPAVLRAFTGGTLEIRADRPPGAPRSHQWAARLELRRGATRGRPGHCRSLAVPRGRTERDPIQPGGAFRQCDGKRRGALIPLLHLRIRAGLRASGRRPGGTCAPVGKSEGWALLLSWAWVAAAPPNPAAAGSETLSCWATRVPIIAPQLPIFSSAVPCASNAGPSRAGSLTQ